MDFPWLTTPSSTQRATYQFSSLVITAFNRLAIQSPSTAHGLHDSSDIFSQNASIREASSGQPKHPLRLVRITHTPDAALQKAARAPICGGKGKKKKGGEKGRGVGAGA